MILVTGELRKILDADYKTKAGESQPQKVLVIEPVTTRQNHEVYITPAQLKNPELLNTWTNLIGQHIAISIRLYVNHDYQFYKFIATGDGLPQEQL